MDRNTSSQSGGVVFFLLGLILALGFGWFVFPQMLYSEKTQPIPFNHKIHMEDVGMACDECHYFREDGSYNGFPSTESCAQCHDYVTEGDTPGEKAIDKFVVEYVETGKQVPWLNYQYQPDNVYFSHIAHESEDCTSCHPDVGNAEKTPVYYENILTGYSKHTMKMWKCERCHAENGVSNACFVCHK
jgi:hypothetical protein